MTYTEFIEKGGELFPEDMYYVRRFIIGKINYDQEKIKEAQKITEDEIPESWIVEGYRARNQQVKDKAREWGVDLDN